MANYCSNHVTFTGKKEDIETLYQRFQKYDECEYFTHFAEMVLGKPLSPVDDQFNGYAYGTKWWDFDVTLQDDELVVSGDSAWSPPLQLIGEITKVFDVEAHGDYYECGMDFAGDYSAQHGVLIDNEMTCFEYDLLQERNYAIDKLIEDINDETYELEYAEGEFKKHLTENEWNQVLTETNNK
jgi:hypothetical protein